MGRGVKLRHDVHAVLRRVVDEVAELLLGVGEVVRGEPGAVLAHHVRFQSESSIGLDKGIFTGIHVIFMENVVVVQVNVQVIHLEPGHVFHHILHIAERNGQAAYVQQEAAHLVAGNIHGFTAGR